MTALGDELPAEDAVLGKVHVGRLQVGVVAGKVLALEVARERPVTELVVLQAEWVSKGGDRDGRVKRGSP